MHVHRHMISRAMCMCVDRHMLNGQPHLILSLSIVECEGQVLRCWFTVDVPNRFGFHTSLQIKHVWQRSE